MRYALALGLLAAVLLLVCWVALARIYLGRHYLTDTLGGALLGAGIVALFAGFLVRARGEATRLLR